MNDKEEVIKILEPTVKRNISDFSDYVVHRDVMNISQEDEKSFCKSIRELYSNNKK